MIKADHFMGRVERMEGRGRPPQRSGSGGRRLIGRTESVCHMPNDLDSIGEVDKRQVPLRTSMLSSLAGKPVAQGSKRSLSQYELQRPLTFFYICS